MKVLKIILRFVAFFINLKILNTRIVRIIFVAPPKFNPVIADKRIPEIEASTIIKPKMFQPSLKKFLPSPISLMLASTENTTVNITFMYSII